ncbi:MAG: NAD(P)-dependent oxidoreductase [Bacteroidota bacterium]|nr:NAD(P)-dependent oxidoreductase [Bacteroidota bacterium]
MARVAFLDTVHEVLWERLTAAGMDCLHAETTSRDDVLAGALSTCSGIVLRSRLTVDAALLDALPELQWVARSGAGLDNIDVAEAERRGVRVISSPEGNATAVGEHAVGQLLALLHKLTRADRHVRGGSWDREGHRGLELEARTVGIIGFGNMGRSFARCLRGFGCRVLAYDKYTSGFAGEHGVEECSLDELLQSADVVSLHVPLTAETRGMVNAQWLAEFAQPLFLLNTARGEVVNTEAVLDALDSGQLAGAALDVLEFEKRSLEGLAERPAALQRLLDHPHTVLSPHIAGWSEESYFKLSNVLADKILGQGA